MQRFIRSVREVLQRCGSFRGRANRWHYWSWASVAIFLVFIGSVIDYLLGLPLVVEFSAGVGLGPIALGIFILSVLPSWTVSVHRLHDIGLTGWFMLFMLIPMVGDLLSIVLGLIPGQKKENRYGPPLA